MIGRPEPSEYAPYFGKYIALVPGDDILKAYDSETATTRALLESISEETSLRRYAPGKWSIRETCVHILDVERIFVYRALCFARGDGAELPSFEPEELMPASKADQRSWPSLLEEYDAVRRGTVAFFRHLPSEAWPRAGIGGGNRMSVRAVAFTIIGHDIHHRRLLRERYL